MDAFKDSLNAMAEMFEQKMSEFQQGLDNGPITNTSLAAEFNSFRTFVLSAMNTLQRQVEFLGKHLGVTGFSVASIKSSHRLGRPSEKKPRPIMIKFADVALRDKVWFSKTGFKGSGLTVSEFLTKSRYNLFMKASRDSA
ncbi:unnamed protein product [Leptidea sinapis]|uniref:Uncharacterized protein n=1 Tax=Leptidea sinapis TaxID=189913 RepID=A0A5E4R5I6_9NEOP|nr:unnamed protein product [Leptidea sinapis]